MLIKKKGWGKFLAIALVFTFLFQSIGMIVPEQASAASTTELTVTKYAADGTTILDQKTVDYHWLEDPDNIPVMGDGVTHYYQQGPVFVNDPDPETQEMLRWNPAEDTNWDTKDMGAVKGTNVMDLCKLVGGMAEGDSLKIKAVDGLIKTFAYENVYQYSDREGPMVVCWYKDGMYPDSGYSEGMRLVWFAEATYKEGPTSIENLPSGNYHVFGNWDWHEAADEEYWYYYIQGSENYPTTTGLSVQKVSELNIFSNEPVPTVAPVLQSSEVTNNGDVSLSFDQNMADPTSIGAESQFAVLVDGKNTVVNSVVKTNTATKIKLELGTNILGGQDVTVAYTKGSDESKQIKSLDGGVLQSFTAVSVTNTLATLDPPALSADSSDNQVGQAIDINFTDDADWRAAITAITVEGTVLADTKYTITAGNINIAYDVFTAAGDYAVSVKAPGYNNATVTQNMVAAPVVTRYVDAFGSADFTTISAAVAAASDGDTIIVKDGTYTENITVDKSLVIRSENGAGQTLVQAAATNANVFNVTAGNVTIDGFTASGATGMSGIRVCGSSIGTCTIINNYCSGNDLGISLEVTKDNTVSGNTCTASGRYGIYLSNTTGNSVTGNTFSNNPGSSYGYGICLFDNANNNTFSGNTSDSNNMGIRVKNAHNNTFINNTISNNNTGMEMATNSVGNAFYLNNFVENTTQLNKGVLAKTGNFWNSPTAQSYTYKGSSYSSQVGNYWSSYTGNDADSNGIGDTPFVTILTDSDNYPLIGAWQDGVITAPIAAVTGVSITEGDQELEVDETVQLNAIVAPENATNKNVSWSSSNNSVASVSATGMVTAVAVGTAEITATTEDGSKTDSITVTVVEGSGGPTIDVLFEGTVSLTPDETFTVTVGTNQYTINENTPLGALHAASVANDFTYVASDKKWVDSGILLLDDIGPYPYQKTGNRWFAYVNGVFKDGYDATADALNIIELADGDTVEYYYVHKDTDKNDLNAVKAAATAAVKTVVSLSTIDVLYDGTVNLDPEKEFTVTAYNSGAEKTVNENTPLGALHKAAIASGFTYDVTDKNYGASGALLLDNIADYDYVKNGSAWYAYVNGDLKDGYNNAAGALNLIQLADGDKVEFYFTDVEDETDFNAVKATAIAAVKITVANGVVPTDWTLQLTGARDENVTRAYFEQGLACSSSGHQVFWTDDKGTPEDTSDDDVWGGVPLWLLVAMVDDNPDIGNNHFNFNAELAAQDYEVKIIAGDGWSTILSSKDIANSDAYIVANTLNGEPLPLKIGDKNKDCWPLYLKGSAISGGQQVGNIVRIELSGLPEPPAGWTLEMIGEVGDTITQAEFEEGLACTGSGHYQEWKDKDGNTWSGVPLWVLLGTVDDIENGTHWTFNDTLADNYTVKVVAGDGTYFKTFAGADVANSNNYIVANKCNGESLTGDAAPLRLVGAGVAEEDGLLGGMAVSNIAKIELPELQTPAAESGSWNLTLKGKISDVISQAEFEAGLACPHSGHLVEWTDADSNVWSGIPLWFLAGWVDDRQPHSYDFTQAVAGYKVLVKASDGYSVDFDSADINKNSNYIIANKFNGAALTDSGPLRLVGSGVANEGALTGKSVGKITEIELTSFATAGGGDIPELRIVKYGEDGVTIIDEESITYLDMMEQFDVIGDGTTVYKYQGITNIADDIWSADDETVGGFKIENAIMGTRVSDLVSLVGGMGTGTDITFVAQDGWETTLPYSSIYPDPAVFARQGDAVIAWYADGKYVPDYKDGMRLLFTPEDHIYGQWDMHETLPEAYWHYYYGDVMYPSCAGLSPKYITQIKVYSVSPGDWILELDGLDIGGLQKEISKTYFESALTCTFGANHKQSYTDSENRVWEGMPLWFLAGFVDDADQHSDNAFNNDLANAGYQVVLTAEDGYSVTIDSQDIIRNNDYIVANTLDGLLIPETDGNWPLKLVGPAVSGSNSIGNIISIELVSSSSLLTPPALTADSIDNQVGQAIDINFVDNPDWRTAITGVKVNGNALSSGQYTVSEGEINIKADVFNAAGDYTVSISAEGYEDTEVIQVILADIPGNPVYTIAPVADNAYINSTTVDGINTMTVKTGVSGFRYFTINITPVTPHAGQETVVFTHLRNGVQLGINATRADFDAVSSAQAGFNVKAGDVIKAYIVDELTNDLTVNPIILQ